MAIRVGLLGAGFIGQTHAQAYQTMPDVELVVVADVNREAADGLAEQTGARPVYDVDAVLTADDIQVVDICLPTFLHERCVVQAAQNGKHVLCEKPVALSLAQADHMIEAIRGNGVIAMVAQVIRFWPQYVAIKQLLESGELGAPATARAVRLAEGPKWGSWFANPELSGGAVLDLHIHDLDYVYWLFGRPRTVYAIGTASKTGAWDYVVTSLDYGDRKATVEASYVMPAGFPFEMAFRLLGTKGCVDYRFRVGGQVDKRDSASTELVLYRPGRHPESVGYSEEDAYKAELVYFVQCVSEGRHPTLATFEEARDVLEIALAARQSLESGALIKLDQA